MRAFLLLLLAQAPSPFELGALRFSQGQFAEARALLEQATAAQPASFQAHFLLGATLVELRDHPPAIRSLRRAVQLDPSHADARKLLATEYLGERKFREAIPVMAALGARCDEECTLLLIEARQGAGETAAAFALAREAARRFPRSAQVAVWLGFQLQFAGRYAEAEKALAEALRLDPDFPIPYQLMGEARLAQDDFVQAKSWLEQAVTKMPGDADVLLSLSRAMAGTGDLAGAVEVLTRIQPADTRVHLQLSRLYYRLGDRTRAEAEAELVKSAETLPVAASPWRKR